MQPLSSSDGALLPNIYGHAYAVEAGVSPLRSLVLPGSKTKKSWPRLIGQPAPWFWDRPHDQRDWSVQPPANVLATGEITAERELVVLQEKISPLSRSSDKRWRKYDERFAYGALARILANSNDPYRTDLPHCGRTGRTMAQSKGGKMYPRRFLHREGGGM